MGLNFICYVFSQHEFTQNFFYFFETHDPNFSRFFQKSQNGKNWPKRGPLQGANGNPGSRCAVLAALFALHCPRCVVCAALLPLRCTRCAVLTALFTLCCSRYAVRAAHLAVSFSRYTVLAALFALRCSRCNLTAVLFGLRCCTLRFLADFAALTT